MKENNKEKGYEGATGKKEETSEHQERNAISAEINKIIEITEKQCKGIDKMLKKYTS